MNWICKFCTFSSANQRSIIRHYKLKHGHYNRSCPLPCIYNDCVCSFKTQVALKNHLLKHESVVHQSQPAVVAHGSQSNVVTHRLKCELCDFSEPCTLKQYFVHLGSHLKSKETINFIPLSSVSSSLVCIPRLLATKVDITVILD